MIKITEDQILNPAVRKAVLEEIEHGAEAKRRKLEHKKRSEVYTDRVKEWVLKSLEEEFSTGTAKEMEHRIPAINLTRKIVDKKARVYKDRPIRISDKQDKLEAMVDAVGLDQFLKRLNRQIELHKNVLVKALPYEVRTEPGRYALGLSILTPESFDVIEDPSNPSEPMAVILSYFSSDEQFLNDYRRGDGLDNIIAGPADDKGKEKSKHFVWWSDKYHFTTDDGGEIVSAPEGQMNPFGMLPFVSFSKGGSESFWVDGGEGLADNCILINTLLADMNFSAKYQSTGIGFLFGDSIPGTIDVGPNKFVKISYKEGEPVPQLGFANPNPQLDANMRIVEQQLAFFLTSEDLEPGSVSGSLTASNASSGIQDIIQRSEPITVLEDEQQLYKEREPRLVYVLFKQAELYGSKKLLCEDFKELAGGPVDYTLSFVRPSVLLSEKEKLENVKAMKETGLYTIEEQLTYLFPDASKEEIAAKALALEAKKAEAVEAFKPKEEEEDADKQEQGDENPEAGPDGDTDKLPE